MTATMSSLSSVSEPSPSVAVALAPLMVAVLVGFLVIGAALPVLPFFVRDSLGFGTAMVGVVAGCQFAAALIARIWAGQAADTKGAKWAVMVGLAGATLAGLLYLASYSLLGLPRLSIGVLLAGRGVLGAAESFIITGATTWGLARVGAHNAGKVIAWMGTAMFAAFAAGAPLGTLLYERSGFGAVSAAAALAPLLTLLLILPLRAGYSRAQRRPRHSVSRKKDLAAGFRRCARQRRLRGDRRLQLAPLRRSWLDASLARFLRLRCRAHRRPPCVRPFAGPDRRRARGLCCFAWSR